MASLMMWNVGAQTEQLENEDAARITAESVRTDNGEVEPIAPPDFNEVETDDSSQLVGLAPREKASYYETSRQYVPALIETADASHNIIIDQQVSSSGTAAARESAGISGHGTTPITIGIEPEIRSGAQFGNSYFERNPTNIQDGSGDYMTPTQNDNWASQVLAARAAEASKEAAQASTYAAFYNASIS